MMDDNKVDTVVSNLISEDEWDTIGQRKKEQLRRCEICGNNYNPVDLRARHLAYGPQVDSKYMIIVCIDCNYRLHLAEEANNQKLKALDDALKADIKALYDTYFAARIDITTDAMLMAVGTHRTDKRPVISHLFTHPHIDGDAELIKDAYSRGYRMAHKDFTQIMSIKLHNLRRDTAIALSHQDTPPTQTSTTTPSEQLILPLFDDEPHKK